MDELTTGKQRHILIVDDNPAIHEDFRKILLDNPMNSDLDSIEKSLFGQGMESPSPTPAPVITYQLHSALQGDEGVSLVEQVPQERGTIFRGLR